MLRDLHGSKGGHLHPLPSPPRMQPGGEVGDAFRPGKTIGGRDRVEFERCHFGRDVESGH